MESKTPMQELLQSAFAKSYYADNGTGIDPQVIDLIDLEEIIQSMLPAESTLIAEYRMMKEVLYEILNSPSPHNAMELDSWVETARKLSSETLKNITL